MFPPKYRKASLPTTIPADGWKRERQTKSISKLRKDIGIFTY
jgi:hypothetical protein